MDKTPPQQGMFDGEFVSLVKILPSKWKSNKAFRCRGYGSEGEEFAIYADHLKLLEVAGWDMSILDKPSPEIENGWLLPCPIPIILRHQNGHRRIREVKLAGSFRWITRCDRDDLSPTDELFKGDRVPPWRIVYPYTETEL